MYRNPDYNSKFIDVSKRLMSPESIVSFVLVHSIRRHVFTESSRHYTSNLQINSKYDNLFITTEVVLFFVVTISIHFLA